MSTALLVAEDSRVESAADLNGGVIAINGVKNITEVGARSWIEENGGDPGSVEFIEIPFPQMGGALAEGRVDAAVIAEPALTQAKESGARILGDLYSAISDEFLITAQFTTSAWAEENPEAVEKFARAIEKGNKWANENPEESARILQQYTEISPEVVESMTRALNGEQFDPALVQPPLDAATKFKILQKPLDAESLTATSAG